MDMFALNGAAINGHGPELVLLDGAMSVDFSAAFDGNRGAFLDGDIEIDTSEQATMSSGAMGAGSMDVALDAGMTPFMRIAMRGPMDIVLTSGLTASAGKMLAGGNMMSLDVTQDITRRAMAQGDVPIQFDMTGDGALRGRTYIEGNIALNLDPLWMDARRTQAHRPGFGLDMELNAYGTCNLEMHDVSGSADMVLDVLGDGRLGGRVPLDGNADMYLYAMAEARRFALVAIEGEIQVYFDLIAATAGRPALPVDYVPAPDKRSLQVPAERRVSRHTTDERRL